MSRRAKSQQINSNIADKVRKINNKKDIKIESGKNTFLIKPKASYLELEAPDVLRFEKRREINVPLFDKQLGRGAKLHGYFEIQNSAVSFIFKKAPC